jgi:hypothetical protein
MNLNPAINIQTSKLHVSKRATYKQQKIFPKHETGLEGKLKQKEKLKSHC